MGFIRLSPVLIMQNTVYPVTIRLSNTKVCAALHKAKFVKPLKVKAWNVYSGIHWLSVTKMCIFMCYSIKEICFIFTLICFLEFLDSINSFFRWQKLLFRKTWPLYGYFTRKWCRRWQISLCVKEALSWQSYASCIVSSRLCINV